MLMKAATVVQQLCRSCRTCFKFYCVFYFTCNRSLSWWTHALRFCSCRWYPVSFFIYIFFSAPNRRGRWVDRRQRLKVKGVYGWFTKKSRLIDTGRHLSYGIIFAMRHMWTRPALSRKDGRLSWPRLPGNAPAGSRTHDLSITSPTP